MKTIEIEWRHLVEGGETWGRFSILGARPAGRLTAHGDRVRLALGNDGDQVVDRPVETDARMHRGGRGQCVARDLDAGDVAGPGRGQPDAEGLERRLHGLGHVQSDVLTRGHDRLEVRDVLVEEGMVERFDDAPAAVTMLRSSFTEVPSMALAEALADALVAAEQAPQAVRVLAEQVDDDAVDGREERLHLLRCV